MRIDYRKYNYCAGCNIKAPKTEGWGHCPQCGLQMRRTPRNYIMLEEEVRRY